MKRRLIATDYDGTLRRLGVITKKDRKNIELFRAAGGLFGVVTGRGLNFIETAKKEGLGYDYLVLYNGSLVLDAEGNTVAEFFIPREDFAAIEKIFEKHDRVEDYDTVGEAEFYRHYYARCTDIKKAREIADEINSALGDKVTAFVNGTAVNVGVLGSSKAQGVRIALAHFGLNEDDAAVVGDDYNDLDMIVSLKGWAVRTGRKAVRDAAPHICSGVGALAKELMED